MRGQLLSNSAAAGIHQQLVYNGCIPVEKDLRIEMSRIGMDCRCRAFQWLRHRSITVPSYLAVPELFVLMCNVLHFSYIIIHVCYVMAKNSM